MFREKSVDPSAGVMGHVILDPVPVPTGTLVYFHGGGWVMGEPEDYLAVCRALAAESGWQVVVANYRKAPEHPFPAAFDDALAVTRHIIRSGSAGRARAEERRIPFGIAGDSAGGNLAAGVAAMLPGELSVQVLITPVLDTDLNTESYRDPQRQLSLTRDAMQWFLDQYLPTGPRDDPRVAPLRATQFSELPETVFVSVASDVLNSEGREYLGKLREAGIRVRHREFEGQMHGFFQLYNVMKSSKIAVSWIADELRAVSKHCTNDH
ncbi:MAG: alpha/beta hydrolase [Leucobacter sp.]